MKPVIFFVLAALLFCCKKEDPNAWKTKNDYISAYVTLEMAVQNRLKSPATAEFPDRFKDHVKYMGNQAYHINSYVDAQNGFGALIRVRFFGKVKQTAKEQWEVVNLEIIE